MRGLGCRRRYLMGVDTGGDIVFVMTMGVLDGCDVLFSLL